MQTNFTLAQLADTAMAESEKILRTCVHCGFCLATCPTYQILGDELDSPRGRIYQIKEMFESDRPGHAKVAKHLDRCLTCLSCMTTCPSGVHYMHLVDHARAHIEETYRRPLFERLMRRALAVMIPRPRLFRLALLGALVGRPFAGLMPAMLRPMLATAPRRLPGPSPLERPQTIPPHGPHRARVALMTGCAQQVLDPAINEATVRLLTRHGVEVVIARGAGCCGAITHHFGMEAPAIASARSNIAAWSKELPEHGGAGLDAVIINTSGCGTTVKDYGFLLRTDDAWAERAARISALTRDVSEFMADLGLQEPQIRTGHTVAYHAACSLQHGQKITAQPKALLTAAGFQVREVPDSYMCCGSAGTYNLLQPELAGELKQRKVRNIESLRPDFIAAGNIGCMTHIGSGTPLPVVHSVELLDWATGGPKPGKLGDVPDIAVTPEPAEARVAAAE